MQWINESISNYHNETTNEEIRFDRIQNSDFWKADMKKQNQDKKENSEPEEFHYALLVPSPLRD